MASAGGLHQRRPYEHPEIKPVEDDDAGAEERSGAGGQGQAAAAAAAAPGRPSSTQERQPAPRKSQLAGLVAASFLMAAGIFFLAKSGPQAGAIQRDSSGGLLLTAEQLAQFDGQHGRRLYLAVMGKVFDVTAGARHYGRGEAYGFFTGRDASRSYVTGKFSEDLHDDVSDFRGEQFEELARWRDFYLKHKEYKLVGKVAGRFYDATGAPTPLLLLAERAAAGEAVPAAPVDGGGQGVPCNVKWAKLEGGSVWCDGGYPRRVMQPDWQGQLQERCACLPSTEAGPAAQLYDGCSPEAVHCRTSPPEAAAAA